MATGRHAGKKSVQQNDFLAPYAPTIGTATDIGSNIAFNDGSASVTFTPDSRNAATSYTVTASTGQTATGSSSPLVVKGMATGATPTFVVTATNSYGTSPASQATSAITITTVPDAPTGVTASSPTGSSGGVNQAGTTTDTISWTAPANGGKAITNYYWESNDGKYGNSGVSTSVAGIGQEGSTAQAYRVYATNANGNSQFSAYSNTITTFAFTPFSVFGFSPFSVFGFSPFAVFGFSPFAVFGFSPSY